MAEPVFSKLQISLKNLGNAENDFRLATANEHSLNLLP